MSELIAVTGTTGALGGRTAELLSARGARFRMLVRDPARAPELAGGEVAVAEFADTAAVTRALAGVTTVLMVSAHESADRVAEHRSFIDGAVAAGVQQIVYISFVGADPGATFTLARDHAATEEYLRDSGVATTMLRDNFYADALIEFGGEDRVIRGPAGDGRVAAVVRADVARTATAVLLDPEPHRGKTYNLTGPQALTLAEVAATVTEITGNPLTYHDETLPEAYESRAKYGAPEWMVDAWVSTYLAIAENKLATVSDDIEHLTGAPPTSLAELLRAG
ncbi:SDR family oxidoreductase [Naumannella halotolerans]|uniref:Uncharacterized protein YbjT (DUF2867 family) n=1 Tax=Naumannella halotolerans TaxID=993414 RepID=A0A4R7IZ31_9ACTN|nr:SDR family oxidoreductase [Naumannella halotolerans]TDT30051.1 uncharacterized protein YbjT (DUF2867 family) [Naumannella halotolerans]